MFHFNVEICWSNHIKLHLTLLFLWFYHCSSQVVFGLVFKKWCRGTAISSTYSTAWLSNQGFNVCAITFTSVQWCWNPNPQVFKGANNNNWVTSRTWTSPCKQPYCKCFFWCFLLGEFISHVSICICFIFFCQAHDIHVIVILLIIVCLDGGVLFRMVDAFFWLVQLLVFNSYFFVSTVKLIYWCGESLVSYWCLLYCFT